MNSTTRPKADGNTGDTRLEFPMRTVMHWKSRVLSAISVCNNLQNFKIGFSTVAVPQWLRVGLVITGCCKLKVRDRVELFTKLFSAMIFISVLLGLMDFSDIVILCSRPNSCCQQNLKCFDMPLLSFGLFS